MFAQCMIPLDHEIRNCRDTEVLGFFPAGQGRRESHGDTLGSTYLKFKPRQESLNYK